MSGRKKRSSQTAGQNAGKMVNVTAIQDIFMNSQVLMDTLQCYLYSQIMSQFFLLLKLLVMPGSSAMK